MSCFDELLSRYKDKLDAKKLQHIYDRVKEYKDDGGALGNEAKALRDSLMHEFKKEVHFKVMEEVDAKRHRAFVNSEDFKVAKKKFLKEVMPLLDSPDEKVRTKAIKQMEKMNLRAPIEAKSAGLETFATGGNRHYSLVKGAKESELMNSFEYLLGPEHVKAFASGELDIDVAKAVHDLGNKKPVTGYPEPVQKMAQAIHRLNKVVVQELTEVGTWIPERSDYIMRQTHDANRIMDVGSTKWINEILSDGSLDMARTFKGEVNKDKQVKILKGIYDSIIDGTYGETSPGAFTGSRNIHFASPEAFIKYNNKYGRGNMHNTIVSTVQSVAKNYARTELFGVNPKKGIEAMDAAIMEGMSTTAKKVYQDKTLFSKNRRIDDQLNEVIGDSQYPISGSKIARTLQVSRLAMAASKLTFSVFSTFTDVSFGRLISTTGVHIDRLNAVGQFFKKISPADRKYWEGKLDMNFGNMLMNSDKYGAFTESDGAVEKYFRRYVLPTNLMNWQNSAAKLTWGQEVAHSLGSKYSDLSFDKLEGNLQGTLKRHGINAEEWDKLRISREDLGNGQLFMTPDGARRAGVSTKTANKLATLIHDLSRGIGSPEAGVKEVAMITLGTSKGSTEREFLKTIGQFKTFVLTVPKVMKRAVYNNPNAKGMDFAQALWKQGEMKTLGMFMAEMTMVSAFGLIARSALTKGEVPDVTDKGFWVEAAQKGAMPMFSSLLIDIAKGEYAKFGRSMLKDMAGPTAAEMDKMIRVLSGTLDKEQETFAEGANLILQYLPGQQLIHMAPLGLHSFADQLKEMQRPGYLDRLEKRKREEGTINPFR